MKAKKIFKGMTAAAVAAVLAASMVPMTAFAENDQLIVPATNLVDVSGASTVVAYKVAQQDSQSETGWSWNTAVVDDAKLSSYNFTDAGIPAKETDSAYMKKLAADLKKALKDGAANTPLAKAEGSENYSATVDDGYYLVIVTPTSTSATIYQPILIQKQAGSDATVGTVKASKIGIDKSITGVNDTKGVAGDSTFNSNAAQVNIGDTVNFKLETKVPNYDPAIVNTTDWEDAFVPFTITDTPSAGLDLITGTEADSFKDIVVKLDGTPLTYGTDNDYTITLDGKKVVVTLDAENVILKDQNTDGVADNAGKAVTVELSGKLNASAVVEGDGNPNKADVKFGNNYFTGGNPVNPDDTTKVYTTQLTITKTDDGETPIPLAGAKFKLYQKAADNTEEVIDNNIVTLADGTATVKGLSAGTYYLQETQAPAGYKLDSTPRTLVIGENGNVDTTKSIAATENATAKTISFSLATGTTEDTFTHSGTGFATSIVNIPGQTLPGTGGIGTTIFTIAGVGVVLVAGAMLVVYMRKRRSEDEE